MVKAGMGTDLEKNLITLTFQGSKQEDLDVLDAIRMACLGEHRKRAFFSSSDTLVIQIKDAIEAEK